MYCELTAEGSLLRGDQDQGDGNRAAEESQRERRAQPVVAVDEGDRDERQNSDDEHARPLDPVDARFAEDDALPAGIEGSLERVDQLTLCRLLTLSARGQTDRELDRLFEWSRNHGQGGSMVGHRRPLDLSRVTDVPANERVETRLGHAGKGPNQDRG